jgi:glycosyltransferase involved in cell wall biosynthesis
VRQTPALFDIPGISGALLRIAVMSTFIAFLYLSSVVLLHGGFAPLLQMAGLLGEMVRSGKSASIHEPGAAAEGATAQAIQGEEALSKDLPLISILIPAYNAQEWIADTIHSAIAQTWPQTEIIIVDDGSSDATLAIARTFESQGVRVVSQKNQGASAARNAAFLHSRGEYIQWLDADDLLAPDKIAKQMELVMVGLSPRTPLSSAWAHFMYRPHRAEFIPSALWCDLAPKEWLLRKMEQNIYMQTATWLVSRELTEAAGPWDIRMIGDDDGEYFCRVLLASNGVRFVHDSKVYYRTFRFDSLSYIGRFPKKIEAHWCSMKLHIQYVRSLGEDARVRAACLQFLRDSLIYFYPETFHVLEEATQLAAEFGEPLGTPKLSWKYSWIKMSLGWGATKPVQHSLLRLKWRWARRLDLILFRLENRKRARFSQLHSHVPTDSNGPAGDPVPLAAKESRPI